MVLVLDCNKISFYIMKLLYKILLLTFVFASLSARVSDRHQSFDPLNPALSKQSNDVAKSFVPGNMEDDDSVNWKRRHKRRKKARRPKRGR